jgi:hypothetical protein
MPRGNTIASTDSIMTAPKNLIQPSENLEVEAIWDKRTAFWDELRGAVTSRFQTGATANSNGCGERKRRRPSDGYARP